MVWGASWVVVMGGLVVFLVCDLGVGWGALYGGLLFPWFDCLLIVFVGV